MLDDHLPRQTRGASTIFLSLIFAATAISAQPALADWYTTGDNSGEGYYETAAEFPTPAVDISSENSHGNNVFDEALKHPDGHVAAQGCHCCQHHCCCGHGHGHGHGNGGDDDHPTRADTHGPAGIFFDHVHEQGEVMFEYRYINMAMQGSRNGTTNVSPADVFAQGGFPVVPTKMNMEMHMAHAMYGLTDSITLVGMAMLLSNTMDHVLVPMNNRPFTTHISGFGDTYFGALWKAWDGENDELIFGFGANVPTGNISRRAYTTPMPSAPEFPYPMRLGTGTVNLRPAVTYKYFMPHSSIGAQANAFLPLGHNWEGYTVSNQAQLNFWYMLLPIDRLAFSFRVQTLWQSNYGGADPDLNQNLVYTNRPDMRGGTWVNFGYGSNLVVLNGHRLSVEIMHPVYQDLDGFQLEQDWTLFTAWSKAF